MKKLRFYIRSFLSLLFFIPIMVSTPLQAAPTSIIYNVNQSIFHPKTAHKAMVASVDALATEVGVKILEQGGNAVDAAVAVGFALAVTHPQAGNLGGGGFMVLRTHDGLSTTIDFREKAPKQATRNMFLDKDGNVDRDRSLITPLAIGVPGTVSGLTLALKKYGTLPLSTVIAPAIKLAKQGFIVDAGFSDALEKYGRKIFLPHAASKAIFLHKDNSPYQPGEKIVQNDLAKSLKLIAKKGADGFYKGSVAKKIVKEMQRSGGLISLADLASYRAIERKPIKGTYKGYDIISMPPPSSGGVHIVEILNILENFDLNKMGHNSADSIHVMSEAMKYAYADRSEYLGDPDFTKVPIKALTSKAYAKLLANQIDMDKARPSTTIKPGKLAPYESDQTTHFSVVDAKGNAVAVTYTLNTSFGSGIVAAGTGILLNNEMDDFSAKPGSPNFFGLIGGDANAVEAEKRPLSSMSPTIVLKDGKPFLVTGSPGGSRIITTVLQVILNTLEFHLNVAEATSAPRIHHQWLPDEIRIEKGISPDTIRLLEAKGHKVVQKSTMGSAQSIMVTPNGLEGSSDPRTPGDLTAGL